MIKAIEKGVATRFMGELGLKSLGKTLYVKIKSDNRNLSGNIATSLNGSIYKKALGDGEGESSLMFLELSCNKTFGKVTK